MVRSRRSAAPALLMLLFVMVIGLPLPSTGQSLANSYSYDPWGETIGSTGTTYNPFLFTGVYKDSTTGLYSMTQRYYQPSSGRFTQLEISPQMKRTSVSGRTC